MTDRITLRRPDDWHLHLRDGAMLRGVLPASARAFARAVVMPNLVPPVATASDARAYRDRILAALPEGARFEPLMLLFKVCLTPVRSELAIGPLFVRLAVDPNSSYSSSDSGKAIG